MSVLDLPGNPGGPGKNRKWAVAAALAGLILLAGAAAFFLSRRTGPVPDVKPGGVSGLRPAVMNDFLDVETASADGADVGKEVDEGIYYPQDQGLRSLHMVFECPFVERQVHQWQRYEGYSEDKVARTALRIVYDWSPKEGMRVALDGWPDDLQLLEKQRNTKVVSDILELIIPRKQESFLSDYRVRIARRGQDLYVEGKGVTEGAALQSFHKIFYSDRNKTFLTATGRAASFESTADYRFVGEKRVIEHLSLFVETSSATLRYDVTPDYEDHDGILLPVRFKQVYLDEAGAPKSEPLEIFPLEIKVER